MLHCMKNMFEIYCGYWSVITEISIVTNDIVGDDSDPEIRRLKAGVKSVAMRKLIEKVRKLMYLNPLVLGIGSQILTRLNK